MPKPPKPDHCQGFMPWRQKFRSGRGLPRQRRAGLISLLIGALLCVGAPAQAQIGALPAPAKTNAETPGTSAVPLRSPDLAIQARLSQLFADVEGLQSVRAQVHGGVVRLTGSVLTAADADRALDLAQRIEGVVSVESELATEHRVSRRLEPLVQRVQSLMETSLSFVPLLIIAALAFFSCWYAGRWVTGRTRLFRRLTPNAFIEALVEQLVRLAFIVLGLVVALSILGATALLGSILGAAGLIGLAVGFAVRDTIENYLAGVMLSIRQPFAPNDHVVIEGFDGQITRLTSRVTVITTGDGNEVQIPNATVYKANIVNFSRTPERRFDFELPLDYRSDVSCALALALGAVKSIDGVLADPAPAAMIDRAQDHALIMKVFAWVDQTASDLGKAKSEAIRRVKQSLEEAKVPLAAPVWNVRYLGRLTAEDEAASTTPAKEDIEAIADTSADHTLKRKVDQIRQEGGAEDLLDPPSKTGGQTSQATAA
jgi:small conductance mechanosensitive channel